MFNFRSFKKRVRARQAQTGESYVVARRRLIKGVLRGAWGSPRPLAVRDTNNVVRWFDGWHIYLHASNEHYFNVDISDEGVIYLDSSELLTGTTAAEVASKLVDLYPAGLPEAATKVLSALQKVDKQFRAAVGRNAAGPCRGLPVRPVTLNLERGLALRIRFAPKGLSVDYCSHKAILPIVDATCDERGPIAHVSVKKYRIANNVWLDVRPTRDTSGAGSAFEFSESGSRHSVSFDSEGVCGATAGRASKVSGTTLVPIDTVSVTRQDVERSPFEAHCFQSDRCFNAVVSDLNHQLELASFSRAAVGRLEQAQQTLWSLWRQQEHPPTFAPRMPLTAVDAAFSDANRLLSSVGQPQGRRPSLHKSGLRPDQLPQYEKTACYIAHHIAQVLDAHDRRRSLGLPKQALLLRE